MSELLSATMILTPQNYHQVTLTLLINILLPKFLAYNNCVIQVVNDPQDAVWFDIPTYYYEYDSFTENKTQPRCQNAVLSNPDQQEIIAVFLAMKQKTGDFKIIIVLNESLSIEYYNTMNTDYKFVFFNTVFIRKTPKGYEVLEYDNILFEESPNTIIMRLRDGKVMSEKESITDQAPIVFQNKFEKNVGFVLTSKKYYLFHSIGFTLLEIFCKQKNIKYSSEQTSSIVPENNPGALFEYGFMDESDISDSYSYPYSSVVDKILVPNQKIVGSSWTSHLVFLQPWFWALLLMSFLFGAIFFYALDFVEGLRNRPHLLIMFGMIFGQGTSITKSNNVFTNIVHMQLLVLSVLFASIYSSGIVTSMVVPTYEDKITTMEDLAKSDLHYFGNGFNPLTDAEKIFYARQGEPERLMVQYPANYIHPRIANQVSVSEYIRIILYDKQQSPEYDRPDYSTTYDMGKIVLHRYFAYTFQLQKSFLIPKLNAFVLHALDTGLIPKLDEIGLSEKYEMRDILAQLDDKPEPEPLVILNMSHLKGVFAFGTICLLLSIIVFIIENLLRLFDSPQFLNV